MHYNEISKMRNQLIPEHYHGREQAYIKHQLLKTYLERLFMIIGQNERNICYVDCFAGPWQEGSENLEDTSIAISLQIMKKCFTGLKGLGRNVRFRALFVEKDQAAFNKLKAFLTRDEWTEIETKALNGKFYHLRDTILQWCGPADFAFFFIDPKGWKNVVEIPTLIPLLQRRKSEFLITFMFDFLLRFHSIPDLEKQMLEIFGVIPNTTGMSPHEKEAYLVRLYIHHLKDAQRHIGELPRSAYVKILDPYKDRTKYDLVYLTRHAMGIKVFMEASEKLDIVQRKVRAQAQQKKRIENTGQGELFPADATLKNKDDKVDISDVKSYWLHKLTDKPKYFGIDELADMLEETGWFISDFQKTFNSLQTEGKVRNLDAKRRRPVHAVHFDKGEYLEKVR